MLNRSILSLAVLILLAGITVAGPSDLLIDVQSAPSAWYDSHLAEKLEIAFSRNQDLRVIVAADTAIGGKPAPPNSRTNQDSLFNWGMEMGSRYLLTVTIYKSGLERRKTFSLPLIFQRWKTIGFIEGELRFLDLAKGRMLAAEEIEIEKSAKDQFQSEGDNNKHDPALHLSAPDKSAFFANLEDELTERLVERVRELTRGR